MVIILLMIVMAGSEPATGAAFKRFSSGPSTGREWRVSRSPEDVRGKLEEELRSHPDRDDLAARLVKGRSPREVGQLLEKFANFVHANPNDSSIRTAHGQLLLAVRRWRAAERAFDAAAQGSPLDFTNRFGKAFALLGDGDRAAGLAVLRGVLPLARTRVEVERASRLLIRAAMEQGDSEAEVEGRMALSGLRTRAVEIFALAAALDRAGRSRDAAESLSRHRDLVRRSSQARARWAVAAGQYLARAGDLVMAQQLLDQARQVTPKGMVSLRRETWSSLIGVARQQGRLGDLKAALVMPGDEVELLARARIHHELGDVRSALQDFDEVVRRAPRDLTLRREQIDVARKVDDRPTVVRLLQALALEASTRGREDPVALVEALDSIVRLGGSAAGATVDQILDRLPAPLTLRAVAQVAMRWGDERRAERSWTALLRHSPADESAVIALGELRLQHGQRQSAIERWRTILGEKTGRGRSDAHARLAEILADHDLHLEALAEARIAVSQEGSAPKSHRLLASILERMGRDVDAEREWQRVLSFRDNDYRSYRREARARLLSLWTRAGSARLEERLGELAQVVRKPSRDAYDRETEAFLAETQIRRGRIDDAIALVRDVLTATVDSDEFSGDAGPELIFVLVRALRETNRMDEAIAWLQELASRFPGRASEARLQIAEMSVSVRDDSRAWEWSEVALMDDQTDARTMSRAASLQARMGRLSEAAALYRRILKATPNDANAALALAGLAGRLGDLDEQRTQLRAILFRHFDDEAVAFAGARLLALEEAAGRLDAMEAELANLPDLNGVSPVSLARRRIYATVLWRLVPSLYHRRWQSDEFASRRLRGLALRSVRPLSDLVGDMNGVPDIRTIEVLGMLGRAEVVPLIARWVTTDTSPPVEAATAGRSLRDEVRAAAVVALGRLGGDAAREALETFQTQSEARFRLPLLWSLGRLGSEAAIPRAKRELLRKGAADGIVACIVLGRLGGLEEQELLRAIVGDADHSVAVRTASVFALGLAGGNVAQAVADRPGDSADRSLALALRAVQRWPPGAVRAPHLTTFWWDAPGAVSGGHINPEEILRNLQSPFAEAAFIRSTNAVLPPGPGVSPEAP